jgi:hypothetical protein
LHPGLQTEIDFHESSAFKMMCLAWNNSGNFPMVFRVNWDYTGTQPQTIAQASCF